MEILNKITFKQGARFLSISSAAHKQKLFIFLKKVFKQHSTISSVLSCMFPQSPVGVLFPTPHAPRLFDSQFRK